MYHGHPDHRAELRATRLQLPTSVGNTLARGKKGRKSKAPAQAGAGEGEQTTQSFPIVVTTYEMCMKDRQWLSGYQWKFIVVDEGHRLKNLDCK
jgi:ATP-dependent DNA helicase